jgi:Antibiotic biosynthesis monooxygenase
MTERARFMARQPGFISVSVHRSLDGRRIVNYIQWQSRDLLHINTMLSIPMLYCMVAQQNGGL